MPYKSLLIAFFACLLVSTTSFGAPTIHFGPVPAWVVPAKTNADQPDLTNARDVNDGYYLKLFEQEVNVAEDKLYVHIIREIITDGGVQDASNLSINFNPAYEQLTIHNVVVWRNGQPMNRLHKEAFTAVANEQELSMFIYNGNYTAYTILEDIRKGDRIEYDYTVAGNNPVFDKKFFMSLVLQGSDPVSRIHYRVLCPASRTLDFKYFNDAQKPVTTTANNTTVYDWDLVNIPGGESVATAPGWFNPFPYVQMSEYRNWNEVSGWAHRINMPEDNPKGALGARIAQVKKQYAGDEAKICRALTDIVQNEVRYMGVEIGTYSHKANSPEKVYAQRYGDCKDKSLLLVSMLRSAGLGAEVALVSTVFKRKIEDRISSPSAFNHAIVLAHVAGKEVWIDPTISFQGGTGTDLYCPDYGKALVLTQGVTSLKTIPETKHGDVKYTETYDATDVQQPVSFTVNTIYSGNKADEMRSTLASQSKTDLEKNYLDYYTKLYPRIKRTDTVIINDDKDANILETIEHYSIDNFFVFDSVKGKYQVDFFATTIRNELQAVKNNKDYPIAVNYPYDIVYTIHVNAPLNWEQEHKTETILRNAYSFSYDVSAEGSNLSIEYRFSYLKDHIAAEEINQYEKDSKKIIDDYLGYSFTYTPYTANTHTGVNLLTIMIFIVTLAVCAYAATRIYKMPTANGMYRHAEPLAIGGWLILPILGLTFAVFRLLYFFSSSGYFDASVWHVYDGHAESLLYKTLLLVEIIVDGMILSLTVFCLFMIYKKRDILPKYVKILFIGSTVFVIADNLLAHLLFPTVDFDYKSVTRSIVGTCIWVPYFSIADRVRDTFVVPYPEPGYAEPMTLSYAAEEVSTETIHEDNSTEGTAV